jgi:hypothetical protein
MWIVSEDKNKTKRWIKYKETPKTKPPTEKINFNLLDYFDIKITTTSKTHNIKMKRLDNYPYYNKILSIYIFTENNQTGKYEEFKYFSGFLKNSITKKSLDEMVKKNSFLFTLNNINSNKIYIKIFLEVDYTKRPDLLDIELTKEFII